MTSREKSKKPEKPAPLPLHLPKVEPGSLVRIQHLATLSMKQPYKPQEWHKLPHFMIFLIPCGGQEMVCSCEKVVHVYIYEDN
jgi:hypothetical protein